MLFAVFEKDLDAPSLRICFENGFCTQLDICACKSMPFIIVVILDKDDFEFNIRFWNSYRDGGLLEVL